MLWDEPKIFFLERRYFFSIILSEFLKNRVALHQRGGEGGTVSKKIKKYVLPYFPYLIAFWFFSKCGTAYRMAAGANLGEKLFGMVKTIGPVFQSYAPGLGLLDLAVGVAGAVILYFVVQSKIKNARKFRRDMEYGSARWSA